MCPSVAVSRQPPLRGRHVTPYHNLFSALSTIPKPLPPITSFTEERILHTTVSVDNYLQLIATTRSSTLSCVAGALSLCNKFGNEPRGHQLTPGPRPSHQSTAPVICGRRHQPARNHRAGHRPYLETRWSLSRVRR